MSARASDRQGHRFQMNLQESVRQQFGVPLAGIDLFTAIKGEGVYHAGKVQWVEENTPLHLTAAVLGSQGETYRTTITLARHFENLRATSECTCPVLMQCKHGAAALLSWLRDRGDTGVPDGAGGFPASAPAGARQRSRALFQRQHALHWARELNAVKVAASRSAADRPHLYYVLNVHGRDARLSVFRIRRLKNGGFSRPDRYSALCEQAFNPPAFWDETDTMVALSLLQEDRYLGLGHSLHGPRARDALLALARVGRLHLDEAPAHPDDSALKPGAELPARIAWLVATPSGDADDGGGGGGGDDDGDEASLRLGLEVAPPAIALYSAEPCYVDREAGLIGPLVLDQPMTASMMGWVRNAPPVPADAAPDVAMALHATYLAKPGLRGSIPELPEQDVRELKAPPHFVLGLFTTHSSPPRNRMRPGAGARSFLAISLAVEYAGQRVEPLRVATLGVQSEDGPLLVVCDRPAERAALALLREALGGIARDKPGLNFAPEPTGGGGGGSSGWLTVAALPAGGVAAMRIKHELAASLQERGWTIVDHSELPTSLLSADDIVVNLQQGAGADSGDATGDAGDAGNASGHRNTADWFELQSGIQIGEQRIDLAPLLATIVAMGGFDAWIRAACPQGVLWMKVSDSEVLRIDAKRIEPLARVVSDWAQLRDDRSGERALMVSPLSAAQLATTVSEISLPEPVRKLRDWLDSFDGLPSVQAPPSFLASLRPYQQDGLAWLQFLAQAGLGGILADDMGLGKTIQVLAHLELERTVGRLTDPVLVVAPTSVIFNWQAEAARHAPGLRLLALTGPGRSKHFSELANHDLVLTSYALLPRDAAILLDQHWHAVILDEAQMIKNPRTQGAATVRALQANHRLALTGTPLENHLGELWSIMHFVLPGLLGPDEAFRSRFRTPIEKQPGTEVAVERLRALEARIRPFLLRRTKQAVLADLPPRTEIIQRVELPVEQRDLYESIRAAMDKRVREALTRAGLAKSQIVMLDALLKLRQACCDPSLVKLPSARKVTRSAKRDALIDLLAILVDEGRKALVFSQFTSMLDLIETAIDADPRLAPVPRARLDGDTADRGGAVERFQRGDAQLFLLSLKAGGVGLNLTAADTVIHYDPWWNPAVENQATDRAHRIGQDKPVFVYKLIAAGTVEERILALQARKAELAAAVLSGSLSAGGKALSQEDLLGLFEPF